MLTTESEGTAKNSDLTEKKFIWKFDHQLFN
ncbi:MAG: hypothetical protein JWM14_2579 [Chitinophagaceae bacterium]|nr:hypothetical protein [Chitinophagaceae bacterium]